MAKERKKTVSQRKNNRCHRGEDMKNNSDLIEELLPRLKISNLRGGVKRKEKLLTT